MSRTKAPPSAGETVIVSPAEDRRVRDPSVRGAPPIGAGHQAVWGAYWQRRLDDEDIVLGDTSSEEKKA
jgi:hypothetical protein